MLHFGDWLLAILFDLVNLPILIHFAQYWGILLDIHQLGSRYFWLTASIWYILVDWVLDNLDNFGQLRSIVFILDHFGRLCSRYFSLTASIWYILVDWDLDNLDNFGQLRSIVFILDHFGRLCVRYFWLNAAIWYILADWDLDNLVHIFR